MSRLMFIVVALLPILSMATSQMRIDGVSAYVNNHIITVSDVVKTSRELQELMDSSGGSKSEFDRTYKDALDRVIEKKLIVDAYEEQKEIKVPDTMISERVDSVLEEMFNGDRQKLIEALALDGMSEQDWRENTREQIIVSAMRNLRVDSKVSVSPLDVRETYDKNIEQYQRSPKVKLRMIVIAKGVDPNEKAQQREKLAAVFADLEKGESFAEVAKKYSEDSRAEEGGDRGWLERDMLREDLADKAFEIEAGKISEPIDIGKQFCILQIEDRVAADTISFDDAQPKIEYALRMDAAKALYEDWVSHLRRKAFIKIVDEAPF